MHGGRETLGNARTVVVKVGSSLLASLEGGLDTAFIAGLAGQLAALRRDGRRVVLVSSGAVAAGTAELGLPARPADLALAQAAAAVGQGALMQVYRTVLGLYGVPVGQMLLTRDGLASRPRFLYARNTLMALLERGVMPIINENDVVAVEELRLKVGDNDLLAAAAAQLADAGLLVILSDVAGLYDRPPSAEGATLVPEVRALTPGLSEAARGSVSGVGSGGMETKLKAARAAGAGGIPLVVAGGREPRVLERVLAGEALGTVFWPEGRRESSWRQWIAFGSPASGTIAVDAGAAEALVRRGRSLLACGVVSVDGDFAVGDTVGVAGPDGRELARGVSNLSSQEARQAAGLRSGALAEALGRDCGDTVIHRDNLLLLERPP